MLDSVLQSWLKPNFTSEFDDFTVDTFVRSELWKDSPPVFLCRNAEAARRLLEAAKLDYVVLHTGKTAPTTSTGTRPLLTLGVDDCRGLEFEELCVLDNPLRMTPIKLFADLAARNYLSEKQKDQVRDTITSWLILMTRCMFGGVWIEERHPIVEMLLEFQSGGESPLLMEVNTEAEIVKAVAILRAARQDAGDEAGPSSKLQILSQLMSVISGWIESHKSITDLTTVAVNLLRGLPGHENGELEAGLFGVSDVLKRIDLRQLPPKDDQKTALALKHFAPLIYGVVKRALDERGSATRGGEESRTALNEAKEVAEIQEPAPSARLRHLDFLVWSIYIF